MLKRDIRTERLRKCMSTNEKYFCQLVLLGKNKSLNVRIPKLAKQLGLSESTIRTAIKLLEVAGYLKTTKEGGCTVIKIINQNKIKEVVE